MRKQNLCRRIWKLTWQGTGAWQGTGLWHVMSWPCPKLGDLPDALSLNYIAKKYFGKSRGWLMQKVNGNKVNGKNAVFTDEERLMFRKALQDLSEKMSAVAMNL